MRFLVKIAVLSMALIGSTDALAGPEYDRLTADQKARIQKGEAVVVTQEDSSSPWPKTWVYRRVDATAEEFAAVFADVELAPSYMPIVKKAKISARPARNVIDVDYEVEVPLFKNETYTTRNTLSRRGEGFEVAWTLVRASTTRASEGYARFETLGTGGFVAYYNFVTPGMPGAGLVKDRALRQVVDTVNAIAGQTIKERNQQRGMLDEQIVRLRSMVD